VARVRVRVRVRVGIRVRVRVRVGIRVRVRVRVGIRVRARVGARVRGSAWGQPLALTWFVYSVVCGRTPLDSMTKLKPYWSTMLGLGF
jgi:hypothetical protein